MYHCIKDNRCALFKYLHGTFKVPIPPLAIQNAIIYDCKYLLLYILEDTKVSYEDMRVAISEDRLDFVKFLIEFDESFVLDDSIIRYTRFNNKKIYDYFITEHKSEQCSKKQKLV
jgi:hypothetical protein